MKRTFLNKEVEITLLPFVLLMQYDVYTLTHTVNISSSLKRIVNISYT